ncbi:GNAT family N-acetyltransferase [Lewinellaceae bacterium SD302]|nr:GNAT family N-acetyltransferase [Lewinellaceae bacterium SD302]
MHDIRPVQKRDLPAIRRVIDSSELFPSEMLDNMIAPFFGSNENGSIWLTSGPAEQPDTVAFCAPEPMTEGTWNLYLIAVHADQRGAGIGTAIMRHLETHLKESGQRVLLVETSGLPEFESTRKFYDQNGYTREARIRDFYSAGEDKIVFHRYL